jgi:hypothetical protein
MARAAQPQHIDPRTPSDNGASVSLKVYRGAPHGLADTYKQQLNTDLLEFIET